MCKNMCGSCVGMCRAAILFSEYLKSVTANNTLLSLWWDRVLRCASPILSNDPSFRRVLGRTPLSLLKNSSSSAGTATHTSPSLEQNVTSSDTKPICRSYGRSLHPEKKTTLLTCIQRSFFTTLRGRGTQLQVNEMKNRDSALYPPANTLRVGSPVCMWTVFLL